jgi:hypothetical protein
MGITSLLQDRNRDIAKVLMAAGNQGDPVDDVETEIRKSVKAADQYGKRHSRYEHEEIVLANEFLAMIQHTESMMDGVMKDVADLRTYASALTEAMRDRVIDLTARVNREKAVISALQGEFKGLADRIAEVRDPKPTITDQTDPEGS